ncbi:MAG: hypothetical protein ABJL99_18875 [Aliishimia sp.]
MIRVTLIMSALFLSVACTQFPELDATVPKSAKTDKYPRLAPIDDLLAQAKSTPERSEQTQTTLTNRAAALRARANRLRGPIIDTATRTRMRNGVSEG